MKCENLWGIFRKQGLTFFTGIPDSTFKGWMGFLHDMHGKELTNIIACNECEAVAIAAGYHLATSKVGVVYMQNAGQGKTVNPITSLADPEVYSIPMILLIGWRGEPGKKDEPQHKKMGRITGPLLQTLEISYEILPSDFKGAEKAISRMKALAEKTSVPTAIIIRKGIVEEHKPKKVNKANYKMTREDAIKTIVDNLDGTEAIISTTGKTSRELYEHRIVRGEKPRDFYMIGSMGCSASIANAIALQKPNKQIFVFDGDGAVLMQMGALATIGHYKPRNIYHIVLDNAAHDSTGGQPTVSPTVEFDKVALACGYKSATVVETKANLEKAVKKMKSLEGPQMLVVRVKKGARADLGRPTTTPIQNKESFMGFLRE